MALKYKIVFCISNTYFKYLYLKYCPSLNLRRSIVLLPRYNNTSITLSFVGSEGQLQCRRPERGRQSPSPWLRSVCVSMRVSQRSSESQSGGNSLFSIHTQPHTLTDQGQIRTTARRVRERREICPVRGRLWICEWGEGNGHTQRLHTSVYAWHFAMIK